MPKQIFISYAQKDIQQVRKHLDLLKGKLGEIFFIDDIELTGGDFIIRKIDEGIEACERVLFFYSKNALLSRWVWYEIGMARAKGKRIIVIELNPTQPLKLPAPVKTIASNKILICYSDKDTQAKEIADFFIKNNTLEFEKFPLSFKQTNRNHPLTLIEEKIDNCSTLIFLISEKYPSQTIIFYMVARAKVLGKKIIPLLIGSDCRLPQVLETYLAKRIIYQ